MTLLADALAAYATSNTIRAVLTLNGTLLDVSATPTWEADGETLRVAADYKFDRLAKFNGIAFVNAAGKVVDSEEFGEPRSLVPNDEWSFTLEVASTAKRGN